MNRHTVRRKYIYKGELKAFMQNYRPNYRNNTNLGIFILHYLFCIITGKTTTMKEHLE